MIDRKNTSIQASKKSLSFIRYLRYLQNEMPMQQADVLLTIAANPGLTVAELAAQTHLAQSSCSRNVGALSDKHRGGKRGLELVEFIPDPKETRRVLLFLTPKGKAAVTRLYRLFDESASFGADIDARVEHEISEMNKPEVAAKLSESLTTMQGDKTRLRKGKPA